MKTILKKTATAFAAVMLLAINVQAVTMLVDQDGDITAFAGWTVDGVPTPVAAVGTINIGGGGAGVDVGGQNAIEITADTSGDPIPRTDIIYSTDTMFTGNFNAYGANNTDLAGVAFDFYAGGGAPSGLGVYLQSGYNASSVWYYDITATITAGWDTYSVSFDDGNWYGFTDNGWGTAASDSFSDALTDVTGLGIYVSYLPVTAGQTYGIDDIGLTVPEPETYLVLGMALLGMAVVFRKRITESLNEARAMMQM